MPNNPSFASVEKCYLITTSNAGPCVSGTKSTEISILVVEPQYVEGKKQSNLIELKNWFENCPSEEFPKVKYVLFYDDIENEDVTTVAQVLEETSWKTRKIDFLFKNKKNSLSEQNYELFSRDNEHIGAPLRCKGSAKAAEVAQYRGQFFTSQPADFSKVYPIKPSPVINTTFLNTDDIRQCGTRASIPSIVYQSASNSGRRNQYPGVIRRQTSSSVTVHQISVHSKSEPYKLKLP